MKGINWIHRRKSRLAVVLTRGTILQLRVRLHSWYIVNRAFFDNTLSLIGTTVITSGLGFVYWWIAARQFPAEVVGVVSAVASVMLLLGTFGVLGLDNFLISEIPRRRWVATELLITALYLSSAVSLLLGLGFALVAPIVAENLVGFFATPVNVILFAAGTALTGASMVLDKALVAYLIGNIQFWRNAIFSLLKILLLFPLIFLVTERLDAALLLTWVVSILLSLLLVLGVVLARRVALPLRPRWSYLSGLKRNVLSHHWLNIAQSTPSLALPMVVVALYGASVGAAFYVTWMFVSLARTVVLHVTTVLHAVSSWDRQQLRRKMVLTLKLSLAFAVLASVTFWLLGDVFLSIFGKEYQSQAGSSLKILAFSVFPLTVTAHYMALARLRGFVGRAALLIGLGSLAQLIAASLARSFGDLNLMALVLLAVMVLEALVLLPAVLKVIFETDESTRS